jgi:hypothetical protein
MAHICSMRDSAGMIGCCAWGAVINGSVPRLSSNQRGEVDEIAFAKTDKSAPRFERQLDRRSMVQCLPTPHVSQLSFTSPMTANHIPLRKWEQ